MKIIQRFSVVYVHTLAFIFHANAKNLGYFWQVTDFHYDDNYSSTGDPQNMCHPDGQGNSSDNIGNYGNYLCDSPWKLINSSVQAMLHFNPHPDFIIWTGDSIPHVDDKRLDLDKVYSLIGNITDGLQSVFPNATIYPVLGNHDPYPSNLMPYDVDHNSYYNDILERSHWKDLLGNDEITQFRNGGYYSSKPSEKLRIIGLNTNLYYEQDKLTKDVPDPANQFKWFESQLALARQKMEMVYIIAHVPPGIFELVEGMNWFYKKYNDQYLNLLEKYSDVILAQLYGHEHTDSFRLHLDGSGKPIGCLFLSPAITPWKSTLPGVGANNPSIRLFQYDRENGKPVKYMQYFLNLTAANLHDFSANWQLEYDTSDVYAIDELNPDNLHKLVNGFTDKSNRLFRNYLDFNSVRWNMNQDCNETCFNRHICAIVNLDLDRYNRCISDQKTTISPPTTSQSPPTTSQSPPTSKPPPTSHHSTTTDHHRHTNFVVPQYMYYVIGALGGVLFLLFLTVTFMCLKKRRRVMSPKYLKFGSLSVNG